MYLTRIAPGRGPSPGCRGRTGACLWRPETASSFQGAQGPLSSVPAAALSGRPVLLAGCAAPGLTHSPQGYTLDDARYVKRYIRENEQGNSGAEERLTDNAREGV